MTHIPLSQELIDSQAALDALRAEYRIIHDKLIPAATAHRELFSKFALEAFEAAEDKLAHILSPQFYDVSVEHLQVTNAFLRDRYGACTSCHNSLTYQRLPQLTFYKNSDGAHNAKMVRLIEDALPHMLPFTADMKDHYDRAIDSQLHGFCLFGTLEHGLSEHASINLYVSHEKKVLVSSTRYSRTTYTKVMGFVEGLDYFIENHYYEDLAQHERDDESDED
jgi:hypothetical protein